MSDFAPPEIVSRQPDEIASIGKRALAQILDTFVVGIPTFLFTLALGFNLTDENLSDSELLFVTVLFIGATLMYNIAGIAVWGATVGKRVIGLKVVNRVDGGPVSLSYAAVRALIPTAVQLVPAIGPGLALVVYCRGRRRNFQAELRGGRRDHLQRLGQRRMGLFDPT